MVVLNNRQPSSHPPGTRTFPFVAKVCGDRIISCTQYLALVEENILSPSTDCPSDLPRQVEGNTGQ